MERPVNDLPPVIVALCLVATVIELSFSGASAGLWGGAQGIGLRSAAIEDYAISPLVFDFIVLRQDFGWDLTRRFVTYPFIHLNFTNALFGIVLLLALGKFVADRLPAASVLILFVLTSIGGAIVFCLLWGGLRPLYGLYTPVFGLIGAYTYVLWVGLGRAGANQIQAFRLIGFLLGLQLVFGLLFGSNGHWVAEVAAFAIGFALTPVLVPGGIGALRARLRR